MPATTGNGADSAAIQRSNDLMDAEVNTLYTTIDGQDLIRYDRTAGKALQVGLTLLREEDWTTMLPSGTVLALGSPDFRKQNTGPHWPRPWSER